MRLADVRGELRGVADHHHRAGAGIQALVRVLLDLLRRHRLHLADVPADLVQRHAVHGQLADLFGQPGGGFQAAAVAADQGGLARGQLVGGNPRVAQPPELAQHQLDHLRCGRVLGLRRSQPQAGVAQRLQPAVGAVGQAALDADLLVQARRVRAAEHRVGDRAHVVAVIAARRRRVCRDHAGLPGAALVDQHDRRHAAGGLACRARRQRRGRLRPIAETGLCQLLRLCRGDVAGKDQDRVVRPVQRGVQPLHVGATDPRDRGRRAAARMAVGAVAEHAAAGRQRGQRGGPAQHQAQVVDCLRLCPLQLGRAEVRLAHHLGQQAQRLRQLRRGHGDADRAFVPAGIGIQRTAQRLGRGGDLRRGPAGGALGQQARGEVGQAGQRRRIHLAAAAQHQLRGDQRQAGAAHADHLQAVRQGLRRRRRHAQLRRGTGHGRRGRKVGRPDASSDGHGSRKDGQTTGMHPAAHFASPLATCGR